MEYMNQRFGNREVIRDYCIDTDWSSLGLKIPKRKDKYLLTRCLNCGSVLPSMKKNLICQPPKRCVFCSNIGNHSNVETFTNSWVVYDDYAVCNVMFDRKIVSFYIDASDYAKVSELTWRISKKKQKYYVVSGSIKKKSMIYLHTFVYGQPPVEYEIDHIDGNSLNNRKANLRIVSHQENVDNLRATRIDNSIGIRGISTDKRWNNYTVDFHYHGKRFYTKRWKTIEEAVWCRYCFEDYYGIPAIKNNPLAAQYFTLNDEKKEEIRQYVLATILGNER